MRAVNISNKITGYQPFKKEKTHQQQQQ